MFDAALLPEQRFLLVQPAAYAAEQLLLLVVVVADGAVLAVLPLETAGLMTSRPVSEVLEKLEELNKVLIQIGFSGDFSPFLSLSFLSLPVIPKLKITDMGLFDVEKFGFVDIEV